MSEDYQDLRALLRAFKQGDVDEARVLERVREDAGIEHLPVGRFDTGRVARTGVPEAILAEGKNPQSIARTFARILERGDQLIATRVTAPILEALAPMMDELHYHPEARVVSTHPPREDLDGPEVLVLCAGTLDRPVAQEAAHVSELLGNATTRLFDVGVAGIHRLFSQLDRLRTAGVIIVVAGMDGALPSVVAGLARQPVIAVPTSVGYGASFGGVAALLTMLNACAPGVAVCNIDNGFGAAVMARKILIAPKAG